MTAGGRRLPRCARRRRRPIVRACPRRSCPSQPPGPAGSGSCPPTPPRRSRNQPNRRWWSATRRTASALRTAAQRHLDSSSLAPLRAAQAVVVTPRRHRRVNMRTMSYCPLSVALFVTTLGSCLYGTAGGVPLVAAPALAGAATAQPATAFAHLGVRARHRCRNDRGDEHLERPENG
jgi:hypothetical protein